MFQQATVVYLWDFMSCFSIRRVSYEACNFVCHASECILGWKTEIPVITSDATSHQAFKTRGSFRKTTSAGFSGHLLSNKCEHKTLPSTYQNVALVGQNYHVEFPTWEITAFKEVCPLPNYACSNHGSNNEKYTHGHIIEWTADSKMAPIHSYEHCSMSQCNIKERFAFTSLEPSHALFHDIPNAEIFFVF